MLQDIKVYVDARMKDGRMKICTCTYITIMIFNPSCSRFMVLYRFIDEASFKKMVSNDVAGIRLSKNFNAMLVENEGHENLNYNRRDLRNAMNIHRRKSRIEGDAAALEKYFEKMSKMSKFKYNIEKDDEGRLMKAFWSDARSRAACKEFGDIITFNMIFLCNR